MQTDTETDSLPRILCVDDEPRVLEGIRRTLGFDFDITTAESGARALELLESEGPFSVTLSDMRMPGMDGATYLSRAAEIAPSTVRMLLTGQADMAATIKAVNEGRLYRFLTKPCEPDDLQRSLNDGVSQYRLIVAEKQLLEQTLYGCIKVLTEVLSLANPVAFNRAERVRQIMLQVADKLGLKDAWQFELAVMLAHVGSIGLSPDLLKRAYGNQPLEPKEQQMVSDAAKLAHGLLEGIPRLEVTLGILGELAGAPPRLTDVTRTGIPGRVAWGAHLVLAAERADQLVQAKHSPKTLTAQMRRENHYDEGVLEALGQIELPDSGASSNGADEVLEIRANQLRVGMILVDDVLSKAGVPMVKAGKEVTTTVLVLLRKMAERSNLMEPVKVMPPRRTAGANAIRIRL